MTDNHEIIAQLDLEHPDYLKDGKHKFNTPWVLWSHAHDCKGWEEKDYIKHTTINTVEDFWNVYNGFASLNNRDMWFLMRNGIPPRWEDPINKEGGSFKFRVAEKEVDNTWLTLSLYLVSESMCRRLEDANLICGLSISPKSKGFSTINVWNLDKNHTQHAIFPTNIVGINFTMSQYQPHGERKMG